MLRIMATPKPSPSSVLFLLLFLVLISLSSLPSTLSAGGSIGIDYGRLANNLPSPQQVVQLLKTQGITKVKLYDTDADVLSSLSGSGISVTVALPNEQLSSAASTQYWTDTWVQSNILPYHPTTLIEAIAVGNEVFADDQNITPFLVPAMQNLYASFVKYDVVNIKVSSPIALSALESSYPPSSGSFKAELVEPVIKPMLNLFRQSGSYLMVNAYPFFAYEEHADTISLDYALFRENKGVTDTNNGLVYKSLLDAQIDAVFAAMNALSFSDINLVVSETGWPSTGDQNEVGASLDNAASYNTNLVRRVLTGGGTPLRPNEPLAVYLFALFNENLKSGPTSERNYGLFYPSQQKVYDVPFTLAALASGPTSSLGQTWCVANGDVSLEKLQDALDYACGEGGADCGPIQPGATCYNPNTLVAHASYAFNSIYQKNAQKSESCDFGGAAYVVSLRPQYGSCYYPPGH